MARQRVKKGNPLNGWIVIDKPYDLGSTDVVRQVKRLLRPQKIGHSGTLDPLATGILPLALGEATKTVPFLMDADKGYDFTVRWGEATSTADVEGEVIATSDVRPSAEQIETALPAFIGEISQTPPAYSAIKVNGQRAYDLARDGQEVKLQPREVICHDLQLLSADQDSASFRLTCGKGFYVRSLAVDLALALGTAGHVTALRRTHVGPFGLSAATGLESLSEFSDKPPTSSVLLPVEAALDDIPALVLTATQMMDLRHGQMLSLTDFPDCEMTDGTLMRARFHDQLVAVVTSEDGNIRVVRGFNAGASPAPPN